MKSADADAAALYNACFRLRYTPQEWKKSLIVLVYKKGNREELSNWTLIATDDVVVKLFAAVLADRLTRWERTNNRLPPAQKGCLTPQTTCTTTTTITTAASRKTVLIGHDQYFKLTP